MPPGLIFSSSCPRKRASIWFVDPRFRGGDEKNVWPPGVKLA